MRCFSTAKHGETRPKTESTRTTRTSDRAAICIREIAPALVTINDLTIEILDSPQRHKKFPVSSFQFRVVGLGTLKTKEFSVPLCICGECFQIERFTLTVRNWKPET